MQLLHRSHSLHAKHNELLLQHTTAHTYARADIGLDSAATRQTCMRLRTGRGSPVAALYDMKRGKVKRMKAFELEARSCPVQIACAPEEL